MKTAILLVTGNSLSLAETLHQEMNDSEIFTLEHFPGCTYISSLSDFIEENFDEYDAFIFICAMGICVRTIAPHVKDKHTDPAVICVDSMGRNAISVLSGHIGQANKITQDVAHILGANPVISTLSDNSGLWALDTLGQEFGWEVLVGMSHAYYKNIELLEDDEEEESDEEEDYNEEEEEYDEEEKEDDEDEDEDDGKDAEKIELGEYLILAIATSIDALAVGISFAALSVDIVPAVSLIGVTTFIFSVAGVAIGHTFGARYEKPATIVGGVVLILIGLKILLEHLGFLAL